MTVATLAFGLGVGSAVFAMIDAVLLRPLPYRDPSRLVFVWQTLPEHNVFELETTPADYAAWKSLSSLSAIGLADTDSYTLTGDGDAERVRGARITASVLPMLGISPRIGRAFDPPEDRDDAPPVVILSDGLWRRRYGSDPHITARTIQVNGASHAVSGVMPAGAMLPGPLATSSDLWLPMRMTAEERSNAISHNYTAIGRVAAGVTLDAASSEIAAFAARQASDEPKTHAGVGARLVPIAEDTVRQIRPVLLALFGGVVLLLLIASANVATLLIVRTGDRAHDSAVRAALGATRARLVSLALADSLLLSMCGGAAGILLGYATVRVMLPLFAASLPPSAIVQIDARIAVVTLAIALSIGTVLGLVAGLRSFSFSSVADTLRAGGRSGVAPRVTRARSALVVAQVAFAVVLLGTAGLLLRSVIRLSGVSPGFSPDHVLTLRLSLDGPAYASAQRRVAFVDELIGRLASAAAIDRAAIVSRLPLGGARGADAVEIEGRPLVSGKPIIIDQRHATSDYFQTMGIRLLRGRALTSSDDSRAEPVTLINRTMANRYFANDNPIDKRVRTTGGFGADQWLRIVGVVDDVRHVALSRPAVPEMYRPFSQLPVADFAVVLKTSVEPASAGSVVRSTVRALDPNLPIYDMRTMEDRVAASFAQLRATMVLLMVTAALAAALAAIAIYGSIWYSVTQRIPEIGLRMALGASPASLAARIVSRAFALTAAGAAMGVAIAIPAASMFGDLLFDTRRTDPLTYGVVIAAVALLTALASIVPARHAIRVDPTMALRAN